MKNRTTTKLHNLLCSVLLLFAFIAIIPKVSAAFRAPSLGDELGCSPTLTVLFGGGEKIVYFDPLRLANNDNFARYRECELKHGRVAMVAVAWINTIPPVWNRISDVVDANNDPLLGATTTTAARTSSATGGGVLLRALSSLGVCDTIGVVVACGLLEIFVFVQRDPQAMPGDYSTGYFGLRDKGFNERSLVSELENGRLAMVAFLAQLVSDLLPLLSSSSGGAGELLERLMNNNLLAPPMPIPEDYIDPFLSAT